MKKGGERREKGEKREGRGGGLNEERRREKGERREEGRERRGD